MTITISLLKKWTETQLSKDWRNTELAKNAKEQLKSAGWDESLLVNDNLLFARMVLPDELFLSLFGTKDDEVKSAPTISRICNGKTERNFKICMQLCKNHMKEMTAYGKSYRYGDDPFSVFIQEQWNRLFEQIFNNFSNNHANESELKASCTSLLSQKFFPKNNERESFLLLIEKYPFCYVLTSLTLIACLQDNWKNEQVFPMILPVDANPEVMETEYMEALKKGKTSYGKGNLEAAEHHFKKALKSENKTLVCDALEALGNVYLEYWNRYSESSDPDFAIAKDWIDKAIACFKESETGNSWYQLSLCYKKGLGRKPNPATAKMYLEKAVDSNCPDALLEQAKLYLTERKVKDACELCLQIVALSESADISDVILKDVYYILYEHYELFSGNLGNLPSVTSDISVSADSDRKISSMNSVEKISNSCASLSEIAPLTLPRQIKNRTQLLQLSAKAGHTEANRLLKEKMVSSILYLPLKGDDPRNGTCFINTANEKAFRFIETIPEDWDYYFQTDDLAEKQIWQAQKFDAKIFHGSFTLKIDSVKPQRFLLLSDDPHKNLQDAVELLHEIHQRRDTGEPGAWDIQIYLRINSEQSAAIIDTMLSTMGTAAVPVYILDDDKDAAQKLLAKHPLFYPIRKKKEKDPRVIHLAVLGTTRCAEWIVREAFHLLTFKDQNIQTKITVLGPDAAQFEKQLYWKCPGMKPGFIEIKGLHCPDIVIKSANLYSGNSVSEKSYSAGSAYETINSAVSHPEFSYTVNSYYREQSSENLEQAIEYYCPDANYFIIAGENDEANMESAIWLREFFIRKSLTEGTDFTSDLPVIAFRCQNVHIAHLSRMMAVQLQPHGNAWYNNYKIIPFGTDKQLYTWNEINGSFLEWQARCIHLQYCNIQPKESPEKIFEALSSYFNKYYNCDSSRAVAMHLPYRLFQYGQNRIVPDFWNILDENTYFDKKQLQEWTDQYEDNLKSSRKLHNPDLFDSDGLARMEHYRWIKFLLSRGWLPATAEQAIHYIKEGNPKHQLYIAKLHPCMCAYEDLAALSRKLEEKAGIKTNFYDSIFGSIEQTGKLISAKWFF